MYTIEIQCILNVLVEVLGYLNVLFSFSAFPLCVTKLRCYFI